MKIWMVMAKEVSASGSSQGVRVEVVNRACIALVLFMKITDVAAMRAQTSNCRR
jgi:hypothetical protein